MVVDHTYPDRKYWFVYVEVIRPGHPNGVMSARSVYLTTLTGQAKTTKRLTKYMKIANHDCFIARPRSITCNEVKIVNQK